MTSEEQVAQLLHGNTRLQQAVELEPQLLSCLHRAVRWNNPDDCWSYYTHLKRECSELVGLYARNPVLATQEHYQAVMEALGTLLSTVEKEPSPYLL